jgi:ABC-2 type transport system ATP-binding protein
MSGSDASIGDEDLGNVAASAGGDDEAWGTAKAMQGRKATMGGPKRSDVRCPEARAAFNRARRADAFRVGNGSAQLAVREAEDVVGEQETHHGGDEEDHDGCFTDPAIGVKKGAQFACAPCRRGGVHAAPRLRRVPRSTRTAAVIHVERLTKRYGERVAVRDLSFSVKKGEVVGFLGPNGAGKSTTLRMLTGFLEPSAGTIRIGDIDALAHPIEARRLIGYMPEAVPLYPEMRIEEYLAYRARLKGVPRRDVKRRVDAALEKARVADVRARIIGQLSKGYKQRVGLADALVADPPLLVLDEPTAGLDPNQIRQVRDLVRSLAGEHTVLLSTHILPEVEAACGRVLILHKGELKLEGETASIRMTMGGESALLLSLVGRGGRDAFTVALTATPGVRRVVDAHDLEGGLVRLRVEADGRPEIAEEVFRAVAAAGLVLRELRSEAISLEDVFAQITTHDAGATEAEAPSPGEPSDDTPTPPAPGVREEDAS